jgi:PAS domain S-box-containing protein
MAFKYAVYGALFGLMFPLFSTLGDTLIQKLPLTLESFVRVQMVSPLHWVINTAPFFLGLFASLAGRRQDQLSELNASLNQRVVERDKAIEKVQALRADLEKRVADRTHQLVRERNYVSTILDTVDALVVVLDQEGRITRFNQACEAATGYAYGQVEQESCLDLFVPEDEKVAVQEAFENLLAGRECSNIENHWRTKEGELRLISWSNALLTDEDSAEVNVVATGIDITERRRAEDALRDSEERYRTLFETLPIGLYSTTPEGKILDVNPVLAQMLGFPDPEALLAVGATDVYVDSWDRSRWQELMHSDGTVKDFEAQFRRRDEKIIWTRDNASVVHDEQGNVVCYRGSLEDITERRQAKQAILEAKQTAEEAWHAAEVAKGAKSDFLARMSHEIRTPLNAILGMTNLLLDTDLNAQQLDYVETSRVSGEMLLTLINDILDFSKIEARRMTLEEHPFDLRPCVEEVMDLVAPKAAEKQLDLAYTIDDRLPLTFSGDVTRIRQILVNLLGNAVKFTDLGEVVVSVTGQLRDGQEYLLHFSVRDTGVGIPVDGQARLFKSFSQVDASTTRKYGGTGLGLAICKSLSEMMGGTTWVESSGVPGEGSTFHFTILASSTSDSPLPSWSTDRVSLVGRRALIVDDNPTNRRILRHYTESWEMKPAVVASGPEALALIQEGAAFDLAILDMQMPEMDGLTLAAEIQKAPSTRTLPLIMLTSMGYQEKGPEAARPAAYLTKPIKPSQLFDVLSSVILEQPLKPKKSAPQKEFDRDLGKRHPLRILLAEDNQVNQKVALGLLERLGYRADVAANGLEVLESLMRQSYDVVLMDMHMPEMGGEEATQIIIEQWPVDRRPRIVAMTANALQGDRERYLSIGLDDYVSKPVKVPDLVRALTDSHAVSSKEPDTSPLPDLLPQAEEGLPRSGTPVDPKVLEDFSAALGEDGPGMVEELVDLYLKDTPDLMAEIKLAITQGELETLQRAAHTLKGNSHTVGAMELSILSSDLEGLAVPETLKKSESVVMEMESEFRRVREVFESQLKGMKR